MVILKITEEFSFDELSKVSTIKLLADFESYLVAISRESRWKIQTTRKFVCSINLI